MFGIMYIQTKFKKKQEAFIELLILILQNSKTTTRFLIKEVHTFIPNLLNLFKFLFLPLGTVFFYLSLLA